MNQSSCCHAWRHRKQVNSAILNCFTMLALRCEEAQFMHLVLILSRYENENLFEVCETFQLLRQKVLKPSKLGYFDIISCYLTVLNFIQLVRSFIKNAWFLTPDQATISNCLQNPFLINEGELRKWDMVRVFCWVHTCFVSVTEVVKCKSWAKRKEIVLHAMHKNWSAVS